MEIWEKKYLVRLISEITSKKILLKIYQIILDQKIKHTRNNNGIFIDLNAIEPEKLEILKTYLYSINI
jgi:hypothetical protein